MKLKRFNKFSGTELRVSNIIPKYFQILNWLSNKTINNNFIYDVKQMEKEFISYCKNENIYIYRTKKTKINRFGMLNSVFVKFGFVKKKNSENKFILNNKQLESIESPDSVFFKNILKNGNIPAFDKMIDFLLSNKTNKIETIPLYSAFATYQETDNFADLYYKFFNITKLKKNNEAKTWECSNYIASLITEANMKNFDNYKKNLNFKKPSIKQELGKKILQIKTKNEKIDIDFIRNMNIKKRKSYSKIFNYIQGRKHNKKINDEILVNKINDLNIKKFIFCFETVKLKELIYKEYYDVWFRWMGAFGFINSKKDINITHSHLVYKNEDICLEKIYKKNQKYPYSLELVNKYLKLITENDFKYKKQQIFGSENERLIDCDRATLAEYFVNLKCAYLLDIKPKDFNKYSNTKVDINLQPIFTAPGRKPDFSYYDIDRQKLLNVETTLHKDFENLFKNEIIPNIRHIIDIAKDKLNKGICKKIKLIIVTPKIKNSKDRSRYKNTINRQIKENPKAHFFKKFQLSSNDLKTFGDLSQLSKLNIITL